SLYFTDAQNGWIVGAYGLALATKDGGKSWQSLMAGIPNVGSKHFYAVSQSKDNLLIAGEQGALFRSTNQGESFTRLQTPY
ncbi:YCF48-related protein, partial [Acinetobacter baumannii]